MTAAAAPKLYRLGHRSLTRLQGLHPDLVAVVQRAIEWTLVDFTVLEGLRTYERQQKLVEIGASKTLNSRHLTGHAVDLGAWVDGEVDWAWPLYHGIANAMAQAARELHVPMTWGGCWDRPLTQIVDAQRALDDYAKRRRTSRADPFLDGPHFELDRSIYPAD